MQLTEQRLDLLQIVLVALIAPEPCLIAARSSRISPAADAQPRAQSAPQRPTLELSGARWCVFILTLYLGPAAEGSSGFLGPNFAVAKRHLVIRALIASLISCFVSGEKAYARDRLARLDETGEGSERYEMQSLPPFQLLINSRPLR